MHVLSQRSCCTVQVADFLHDAATTALAAQLGNSVLHPPSHSVQDLEKMIAAHLQQKVPGKDFTEASREMFPEASTEDAQALLALPKPLALQLLRSGVIHACVSCIVHSSLTFV